MSITPFTWYNRLSNRFDNRLYHVNGVILITTQGLSMLLPGTPYRRQRANVKEVTSLDSEVQWWWMKKDEAKRPISPVWVSAFCLLFWYKVMSWRSGNSVRRINEVTLRQAQLALGWMTAFGGQTTSAFHKATEANSASYPQRDGKWLIDWAVILYSTRHRVGHFRHIPQANLSTSRKCGDALRLGSKGWYGSFHLWINVWMTGLCDPFSTRATPEHFGDEWQ